MTDWVPVRDYRDFWDVPRIFFVERDGHLYLFDCPFDEETEDFPETYRVSLMPPLTDADLSGSWVGLSQRAIHLLGVVPIAAVTFDPTRRKEIRAEVFDLLPLAGSHVNGTPAHADAPARSS
jgi:hypothetical protein